MEEVYWRMLRLFMMFKRSIRINQFEYIVKEILFVFLL